VAQLEQAIATARIGPPSARLTPQAGPAQATTKQQLARRLRGNLDAIALKALSTAPQQRYASVSALADDLRHHLGGESIQARPDRLATTACRFFARHRAGAAAAAGATVAALAAVCLLTLAPMAVPADGGPGVLPVSDRSIAVLPFLDMSENKDQDYFADGMTEEILDLLSNVPELQVPARTSSFFFKGRQSTIADISRALGVGHLLQGSVRKAGNRLRISVQLVRADKGHQLWSQTYDRNVDDMFKVQDEIASAAVKAVRASLLAEDAPKPTGAGSAP
jgi:TolB-like protein